VEDFFQNILSNSKTVIPKLVVNNFTKLFPEAMNIEWYLNGDNFEAVFHENDLEKIAFIDKYGNNIETKVNLPLSMLSTSIVQIALKQGEIMNAIKIITKDSTAYEIIVRDLKSNRYRIEIDEEGGLFNKKLL
jgi:hypothetical protein